MSHTHSVRRAPVGMLRHCSAPACREYVEPSTCICLMHQVPVKTTETTASVPSSFWLVQSIARNNLRKCGYSVRAACL